MDLAGLNRAHLQTLCKQHGLPAVGPKTALVARLADVLKPPEAAGAGEDARATKGCLKRAAAGKDSRDTRKVSFVLEESREKRRQSQVFSSPSVATGRHRQLSSFVEEEEEQAAAPRKSSPLFDNATSEAFQNIECGGVGKRPFVEEEEQAPAPCKSSPLLVNATSEAFENSESEGVGKRPFVEEERAAAPCKPSPLLENATSEEFQNIECEGVAGPT